MFLCFGFSAKANVYATDIRLNGSLQTGLVLPGSPVTISFILNDAARNVSLQICSGTNVLKTFVAGTNAGLNSVVWNGTNDDGTAAVPGVYSISITAASAGYEQWTNITDDGTNFDIYLPTGIAVNKNNNSPYYGRVFAGNALPGNNTDPGIFKYNADGSPAEEGSFSTGGYPWSGGGYPNPSPWKMDTGSDDRLYVEDWGGNGTVMSFDQVVSTNYLDVLRSDNYLPFGVVLDGPCIWGESTNMQLFMADVNPEGNGVISWALGSSGIAATNDYGTIEVAVTNSDLTLAPYAVAVDTNGDIFAVQRLWDTTNTVDDTTNRVFCFPPYPNGGPPDTSAIWKIGGGDATLENTSAVAVDPTSTYVAVANRGFGQDVENLEDGGISIFFANSGTLVTNIMEDPEGFTNQECIDVAWDNVGNLYVTYFENDFSQAGWRVYSPPGTNQATTVAVPFIQVYSALTPPQLSQSTNNAGQLGFTLVCQSNVTYIIQQSPDLVNWTPIATNFCPGSTLPVTVSPPDLQDFYRAVAVH